MPRFGPALTTVTALTVLVALSGCTAAEPIDASPSPSATYAPTGDGVLRIGTVLPPGALAQVAGVEIAVREINEQGGLDGVPVEVFHRTSGDPATDAAEASFAALIELGVDVVIGPSSTDIAERLIGPATEAGVPLISPSATGLGALDDEGMLFSAAVAGGAEWAAIADALAGVDASSIAYLSTDDSAGADGLASLTAAMPDTAAVEYEADFGAEVTDFASIAKKAAKAKPDAVVISAATAQQAVGLLSALSAAGIDGSRVWLDGRTTLDYSTTLAAGVLEGATGIVAGGEVDEAFALRLRQADPAVGADSAFAAEAYDATIMAALAVLISGDDGGPAIARHLRSISVGGIPCTSFGECASVLATEPDIDYTGRSGPVDLSESGDAAGGTFTIVAYAASNSFAPSRTVTTG